MKDLWKLVKCGCLMQSALLLESLNFVGSFTKSKIYLKVLVKTII